MSAKKRNGVQKEDLETETSHILEEARMVLPGVQALFGFQLIAVFNATFHEKLSRAQQSLHFVALCLVAIAAGMVMTPAAYHRQVQRGATSRRFTKMASRLLTGSLVP